MFRCFVAALTFVFLLGVIAMPDTDTARAQDGADKAAGSEVSWIFEAVYTTESKKKP